MRRTIEINIAANLIYDEYKKAIEKFPAFNTPHEGYAVILEELDEMWEAIKGNDIKHSVAEAAHVGAMAMRYIIDCGDIFSNEAESVTT